MTSPLLWFGLAIGVLIAGIGVALLSRRAHSPVPSGGPSEEPAAERLPRTPVETRALWGLVIGGLSAAAALAIVAREGPTSFHENESMRLLVYGVFAAAGIAYGIAVLATRRAHRGEVMLDERDLEILARAPRVQAAAILATLLVWAIALTELYWDSGQVPIAFPFLMFLSSCVVGLLAFSAGILIGYRSS